MAQTESLRTPENSSVFPDFSFKSSVVFKVSPNLNSQQEIQVNNNEWRRKINVVKYTEAIPTPILDHEIFL